MQELIDQIVNNSGASLAEKRTEELNYSLKMMPMLSNSGSWNDIFSFINNENIQHISFDFCNTIRCQTYTEDYGALSAEERFNLIKNDTYKLITVPAKDDLCIFIDDISITGTHQRVVEDLLDSSGIETNSFFLYFAKLSNSDVCPLKTLIAITP